MGRKRKKFGEQRQPISISLPRNLIMDMDRSLHDNHSRSRLFERLLKNHLAVNTKLSHYTKHEYECLDCGRTWAQKTYEENFVYCLGKNGCGNGNIRYLGIWGEEE